MKKLSLTVALISLLASINNSAFAQNIIRIVVLPYYTEEGHDIRIEKGNLTSHYRRIQRFVNNQLVRHGFEVINPFAQGYIEEEYNATMARAREDSALAARSLTQKYGVDVVYVVNLRVVKNETAEGLCKIRARVEGEGYDSAARDLGVGWEESVNVSDPHCDEAIIEAERIVADRIGRALTASANSIVSSNTDSVSGEEVLIDATSSALSACEGEADNTGGALQRSASRTGQQISLRFDGADSHEQVEIFGKVINTARGVDAAKVYRVNLVPDNPQASQTLWRVTIACTDTFRLASNVNRMLRDIVAAKGRIERNSVVYEYTMAEVDLLRGVRINTVTSREIQFVLDRKAAQRKELMEGN